MPKRKVSLVLIMISFVLVGADLIFFFLIYGITPKEIFSWNPCIFALTFVALSLFLESEVLIALAGFLLVIFGVVGLITLEWSGVWLLGQLQHFIMIGMGFYLLFVHQPFLKRRLVRD